MCIAILSENGVELPNKETLKLCFTNNPDGAGYAVLLSTKEWECKKGFMSWKSFWKSFRKENYTKEDTVVIHFRIGTSGKQKHPDCTHPFPITDNEEDLILHNFKCNNITMHNGTCGRGEGTLSDTMVAIINYIEPLMPYIENDKIINIIQKCIGSTSRWFIAKQDSYWMIGDWEEEKETGIWYSNKGYIPCKPALVYRFPSKHNEKWDHTNTWYNSNVIMHETGASKVMYFENDKWSWDKWDRLNRPLLDTPKPKDKEYEVFDENNELITIIDADGDIVWQKEDEDIEDYDCPYCKNSINDELLTELGECPYCHEIVNYIMYNCNIIYDSPKEEEFCCPSCGEKDYIVEPHTNIADSECCKCGAIFNDNSTNIVGWAYNKLMKGGE